jgi:hypothetical protein
MGLGFCFSFLLFQWVWWWQLACDFFDWLAGDLLLLLMCVVVVFLLDWRCWPSLRPRVIEWRGWVSTVRDHGSLLAFTVVWSSYGTIVWALSLIALMSMMALFVVFISTNLSLFLYLEVLVFPHFMQWHVVFKWFW